MKKVPGHKGCVAVCEIVLRTAGTGGRDRRDPDLPPLSIDKDIGGKDLLIYLSPNVPFHAMFGHIRIDPWSHLVVHRPGHIH